MSLKFRPEAHCSLTTHIYVFTGMDLVRDRIQGRNCPLSFQWKSHIEQPYFVQNLHRSLLLKTTHNTDKNTKVNNQLLLRVTVINIIMAVIGIISSRYEEYTIFSCNKHKSDFLTNFLGQTALKSNNWFISFNDFF